MRVAEGYEASLCRCRNIPESLGIRAVWSWWRGQARVFASLPKLIPAMASRRILANARRIRDVTKLAIGVSYHAVVMHTMRFLNRVVHGAL